MNFRASGHITAMISSMAECKVYDFGFSSFWNLKWFPSSSQTESHRPNVWVYDFTSRKLMRRQSRIRLINWWLVRLLESLPHGISIRTQLLRADSACVRFYDWWHSACHVYQLLFHRARTLFTHCFDCYQTFEYCVFMANRDLQSKEKKDLEK